MKRITLIRFIIFLLLVCETILYAQDGKVTGTIYSADDNELLIGVNIIVEGSVDRGTISDINGEFSILASVGETMKFVFLGMEELTLVVEDFNSQNIFMYSSAEELAEFVAVGYGVQKRESVVGAVSQVASEDLLNSGVQSVSQAITGKLSGVITMQNNGMPGADDPAILIRGKSTWNDASPLIMVDGIERSFSDIDPNEIATISVLKDASATAVYGTKGANGVILVTTKRGTISKPKINFTFNQGFKQATSLPTYIDAYTTLTHANVAMKNDNYWGALNSQNDLMHYKLQDQPYLYPSVDWADEMLKIGYTTSANVNLRGGSKKVKYFASLGYLHDGDIINTEKQDDYDPRYYSDRYNLRSNLDFDLSEHTVLSANISGSVKKVNGTDGAIFSIFESIYAGSVNYSPVYYGADALEMYPDPLSPGSSGDRYAQGSMAGDNPYSVLYAGVEQPDGTLLINTKNSTVMDLNTDMVLKQDLDFITKGLKVSGLISLGTMSTYARTYLKRDATYLLSTDGSWSRTPSYDVDLEPYNYKNDAISSYNRKLYWELKMNYDRTFGKHYVTAMGIFNRRSNYVKTQEPYKIESWAGRATYAYDLRYMFEINLGYTGSEQFAPGNRFGFFPAYAVGWNIGQERFVKENVSFISKLKVRYSYGKTGNDNTNERWLYYSTYETVAAKAIQNATIGGSSTSWWKSSGSYAEGAVANSTAQWEEAIKNNFGVELGLFADKLSFSLDLFKESRDNILMEPATIPEWVHVDFKPLNIGATKNHGYEIEMGYNNKTTVGLNYFVKGNFSFSENRVVYQDDPPNLPSYQKSAGFPIGYYAAYLEDGLYQSVDDIVNYATLSGATGLIEGDVRYIDYNGDGKIDSDDKAPIKDTTYPLYNYGLTLGIDYKGFSVNAMVQGMEGKSSTRNQIGAAPFARSRNKILDSQLDYWTSDNTGAFYPSPHYSDAVRDVNNDQSYSMYSYLNTSFVRLKELQLGYTFNPKWVGLPISYLMVYVSGNNLITFTEFDDFGDPEKSNFDPGATNSYPLVRRYNIGFKLNF